ncbi:hypothetical protein [Fusobacterium varium]|uniref:hypothetical protein n=1 Tax=Fusobacterium varium TaxID=856 RepID=UPI003F051823
MERAKRKKRQKNYLELIADLAERLARQNNSIEVYEEVKDIYSKMEKLIIGVNDEYYDRYEDEQITKERGI